MTSKPCIRCGQHWAFNSGNAEFKAITKWCPSCLPLVLPVVGRVAA
jgi:hypothetical protein